MRRIALSLLALLAASLGSPLAGLAADPAPSSPTPAANFDALVKKGDQARIAGQWSLALKAYVAALEIRDDALVAGRLGLVLVEFRAYESAAGKLFQAIERGAGANDAERTRFFQAFLVAKKETCRIDVVVVQNDVKLELDGEPRFGQRREFWVFVGSGKHQLKATLEGFEDETVEIDAPKGGQLNITVSLRPVKPKAELANQTAPQPPSPGPDLPRPEEKPAPKAAEDKPTPPTNTTKKNGSFVTGLGVGFVFGTTPTPAVGPNAFISWRSRSWWEVGVDARVAWTFVKDERAPTTQFVTWSARVVPCGRSRTRWFGCGLVGLDGVARAEGEEARLLPGFGLRGGVEFETHKHLGIQLVGDVVIHHRGFSFRLPETITSWTGPFVTGALAVRGVIKP